MYTHCVFNILEAIIYYQNPNLPSTVLHRSHNKTVKLDKKRTDRTVITVNIMLLNLSII